MIQERKSAFIAIVGIPNVGKSSILNAILGQKISIVSSKPQTTRTRVMGILTIQKTQLVFMDTPGLHEPKNRLGKYMEKSIKESVSSVDACLLVIEAGTKLKPEEIRLIEKLKKMELSTFLAINKIDILHDKSALMDQIDNISKYLDFKAVIPVSAKRMDGIDILINELKKAAVQEGHFFEEDALTDQPERVIISEIIREKILRVVNKEIPHGVAVCIEKMRERKDNSGLVDIDAVIYCEKNSHKGILIGKQGIMLKKIGSHARYDIERFLGTRINLQLWIKVKEDWRNRTDILKNFGFDEKNFNI